MFFSNKKQKQETTIDYSNAKRLYFLNYANYENMKRNGEYKEYKKYMVPSVLEQEWSRMIKDDLVKRIQTGEDIWLVSNLANIRLNESEIIDGFQILSKSSNVHDIWLAVERSKPLIPSVMFETIIKVLMPETDRI